MYAGLIGAIVGCVLGLAGGIIGTYFSIKNTNGPKERAFMVRAAVIGWIAIGIFLALLLILPSPYRYFMWIPYGILLPIGIIFGNKRQAKIRAEESKSSRPAEPKAT
jgi:MFS family permease